MEKTNVLQISTEPVTSNTASSPPSSSENLVQEVEDTSDFFASADADSDNEEASENEAENLSPTDEESEEEESEEESEDGLNETEIRNVNAIANIVGSAATDSAFAHKLYKGLCVMKDLIESLEARGVVFEVEGDSGEEEDEEGEEEEEEEEEEQEMPLLENAPAVEKVSPLPNAESMIGTNIPLGEEKPSESLTPPPAAAQNESKSVLNTLTGYLTGKTPLFSKTRRSKHRRSTSS